MVAVGNAMLRLTGYLWIVSALCVVIIGITTGAYSASSGRQIGEAIGASITLFILGFVVAGIVRLIRGRDPGSAFYPGTFSGFAAIITFAFLMYVALAPGREG